jgi:hypothetical protein
MIVCIEIAVRGSHFGFGRHFRSLSLILLFLLFNPLDVEWCNSNELQLGKVLKAFTCGII